MGSVRIGWLGTRLKEKMNSPQIRKTASGPAVVQVFTVNYEDVEVAITAYGVEFGDVCPIAAYADALLVEIVIAKQGPTVARVDYIYQVVEGGTQFPPAETIIKTGSSNAIEIPIAQAPNVSPGTDYDPKTGVGLGALAGIESFLSPQPVYGRREIVETFTFSEANLIENVAKRQTGTQMGAKGLSAATTDKWLKMELSVRTSGENFEITERWQYASEGWSDKLYEAAT